MSKYRYMWTATDFDLYVKDQVKKLRSEGFKGTGTAGVTQLLYTKVIIPNAVDLTNLLKEELKFKKEKKWKRKAIF